MVLPLGRLDQVAPESPSTMGPRGDASPVFQYELVPVHALPVVDLSVSLRSRWFSESWFSRTTSCLRHGRLFFGSFIMGMVFLLVMLVVQDTVLAQGLAVVSCLLQLPSYLIGSSVLRYEMVGLLVRTYDFWFFFLYDVAFIVVMSMQLGDARSAAVVAAGLGIANSILADGNLRGTHRTMLTNVGAVATALFFIVGVKIDLMASLQRFTVVRYGVHEIRSDSVVVCCLITLVAMIVRNISRTRRTLRGDTMQQVQCVSYRCLLRLVWRRQDASAETTAISSNRRATQTDEAAPITPVSHVQQLQCVLPIGLIDARRTAVPWMADFIAKSRLARIIIRTVGASAFALTVLGAVFADYRLDNKTSSASSSSLQIVATVVSSVFVLATGVCYLRQLHDYFVSCFDFIFVSWQLSLTHFITCDYFMWRTSPCLVVFLSWMWIHWAMCVDELSPLVKDTFRVQLRFPAIITSTAFAAYCLLVYGMIVLDQSEIPYNRVIWSGTVHGKPIVVHVLPLFYSSVADVLAWFLRLLYRQWTFDSQTMIVLDGPVAYTNYLRHAPRQPGQMRQRILSRTWTASSRRLLARKTPVHPHN